MLEALDARAVLDEKGITQVIKEAIAQYPDLPFSPLEERVATLEERLDELSHLVTICSERFK
jgi:hypothetical protein